MGLFYENEGIPRIGGRILGLLLLAQRPVSPEEMSDVLMVSRSSISTNLRTLQLTELVEKESLPGDRIDYYIFAPNAWEKFLEDRLTQIIPLKEAAEEGLQACEPGHPGRQRLNEMIEWADLLKEVYERVIVEWQSRHNLPA
jgi:DNA-binding transcriptional regulator GbsR (MarR family)